MRILFVSKLDRYARAVRAITKYVQLAPALGHEAAVFGEQRSEPPVIPCSLDVKAFDYAVFVIYNTSDFPDLPYLARLLDGIPRERRVVVDCVGRYNETIRIDHDFNHLEKLDGHQGWEWIEGFEAVSEKILQPALQPLRSQVRPFLFHGFDPADVAKRYLTSAEAAREWAGSNGSRKPYGLTYVGNNWQRWGQLKSLLEAVEPLRAELGPIRLAGWDWDQRPEWAVQLGLEGVDVDPALLQRVGVETSWAVPFDEVVPLLSQGRFSAVIHRPLFSHLGLVTNRTFETFCADTLPLLILPEAQVEAIYGPAARKLVPGGDVAGRVQDMIRHPETYWDAVLKTRAHLAEHHSYERRFRELVKILES
jgi:hypothetical protein